MNLKCHKLLVVLYYSLFSTIICSRNKHNFLIIHSSIRSLNTLFFLFLAFIQYIYRMDEILNDIVFFSRSISIVSIYSQQS